jgi:hypothetical protein
MLHKKTIRETFNIFLFFVLLLCSSFSLYGQNGLVLLQSQSIAYQTTLNHNPGLNFSYVFRGPSHKLAYEREMCSRVLGNNLMFHCTHHDLFKDINRLTKQLDGFRKFESKCGRVKYKINDDNFSVKINLNNAPKRS